MDKDLDLPDHYRRKIRTLLFEYNRPFPGPYYYFRLLRGKKEAKILDVGSGPVCTLGNLWGNVKIEMHASDLRAQAYADLVKQENVKLLVPIEYQNMEAFTYPDETFDVVHCVNALDHVKDAQKALDELKRVCKKEGYVYLRHARNQKSAHKGNGHYWDAKIDGFYGDNERVVSLKGFKWNYEDGDFIINIYLKR